MPASNLGLLRFDLPGVGMPAPRFIGRSGLPAYVIRDSLLSHINHPFVISGLLKTEQTGTLIQKNLHPYISAKDFFIRF